MAQDSDIRLNLTGFDENSYDAIRNIVFDLFKMHCNDCGDVIFRSIDETLKIRIDELMLNNLNGIMEYIKYLPDCEIIKLFDFLIKLSSIKMKFSNGPHSVGENTTKVVLRKYDGVKFIE